MIDSEFVCFSRDENRCPIWILYLLDADLARKLATQWKELNTRLGKEVPFEDLFKLLRYVSAMLIGSPLVTHCSGRSVFNSLKFRDKETSRRLNASVQTKKSTKEIAEVLFGVPFNKSTVKEQAKELLEKKLKE